MGVRYPNLEARAYRAQFSSGLLEVFIGLALAAMGALWLTDLAGIAGVVPALIIPLWTPVHRRFVEPRAGFVRVGEQRQQRERSSLIWITLLGVAFLAAGIGMYVWMVVRDGDIGVIDTFIAGLPAFLLAIGAFATGGWLGLPRLFAAGGVLVVGGLTVVVGDWHPGLGMLLPGALLLPAGIGLFVRFVGRTTKA